MKVYAVIGANFGDEGKGLMTDYFASQYKSSVVILSNGGAQRGHTVVTPEGYRHIFHHFGSNSFLPNSKTYIPEYFVVNPVIFRQEYEKLAKQNINPIVYIHPSCLLTTIFDMLINQAIEIDRADHKHGSCGIGLYETLYRNQLGVDFKEHMQIKPLAITVNEFYHMNFLTRMDFLHCLRDWYVDSRLNELHLKRDLNKTFQEVLKNDNVIINFIDDFDYMMNRSTIADYTILKYGILKDTDALIFENGQGLLLDQHNMEYFPHLTPSNTGLENCIKVLNAIDYEGDIEACYVTRTYMTRHGVGKFDTECSKADINPAMIDLTNVPNPFQDSLRYGWLDPKDIMDRTIKDTVKAEKQADKGIIIFPTIAVTHENEFSVSEYDSYFHLNYLSEKMTRNGVTKHDWDNSWIF